MPRTRGLAGSNQYPEEFTDQDTILASSNQSSPGNMQLRLVEDRDRLVLVICN